MRNWLILVLALFVVWPLPSQEGDARPKFEVAAIKHCDGTEPRGQFLNASPRRLSVPCSSVERLIQDAYQIFADGTANFMNQGTSVIPIEGFPNQMSSDRYSIEARTESPQTMAIIRGPMMQRLLEDRFHLRTRHEIRQLPVYVMTAAKDGPKLQTTTEDSCDHADTPDVMPPGSKPRCGVLIPPAKSGTHFVMDERGITIELFARIFKIGGRPVIDRTGITGTFDIYLEWEVSPPVTTSPENGSVVDPPDTSIISSIRKQLGLQLTPGKGPREFLIIDHLERPTEN